MSKLSYSNPGKQSLTDVTIKYQYQYRSSRSQHAFSREILFKTVRWMELLGSWPIGLRCNCFTEENLCWFNGSIYRIQPSRLPSLIARHGKSKSGHDGGADSSRYRQRYEPGEDNVTEYSPVDVFASSKPPDKHDRSHLAVRRADRNSYVRSNEHR